MGRGMDNGAVGQIETKKRLQRKKNGEREKNAPKRKALPRLKKDIQRKGFLARGGVFRMVKELPAERRKQCQAEKIPKISSNAGVARQRRGQNPSDKRVQKWSEEGEQKLGKKIASHMGSSSEREGS